MVPLSEYATVAVGSTLFEAVLALETAQEEFEHAKYRHRAVLIMDKNDRVIGKLSQLDVLNALEPKDEDSDEINQLRQYGFSASFISTVRKQRRLQKTPFKNICRRIAKSKVENFMQAPSEGEFIDQEASLEIAVLQLVMGRHLSLLVTHANKIVGILRMSDVFAAIFHTMKECETN
jgi:CBS domain-containing protein